MQCRLITLLIHKHQSDSKHTWFKERRARYRHLLSCRAATGLIIYQRNWSHSERFCHQCVFVVSMLSWSWELKINNEAQLAFSYFTFFHLYWTNITRAVCIISLSSVIARCSAPSSRLAVAYCRLWIKIRPDAGCRRDGKSAHFINLSD